MLSVTYLCLSLLVFPCLVRRRKIDCISTSLQPCLIAHLAPDRPPLPYPSSSPLLPYPYPYPYPYSYPHTPPLRASFRTCPSPLVLPRCRAQRFQSRAVVHHHTSLPVSHEDGDAILECRTLSRFLFVLVLSCSCSCSCSVLSCPHSHSVTHLPLLFFSLYSLFRFLVLRFLSFFEPQLD